LDVGLELAVRARRTIGLFHPDGPNDVAPSAYNLPELPDGLPQSPLVPDPGVPGFRWAGGR